MTERVLVVDDEQDLAEGLKKHFYEKHKIEITNTPMKGLTMLAKCGPYAVVVSGKSMPEMDGVTFLQKSMEQFPNTSRILLTGSGDYETAMAAINKARVFRFFPKPCSIADLGAAIEEGILHYSQKISDKERQDKTLSGSINLIIKMMEATSPEVFRRVSIMRATIKPIVKLMKYNNLWELDMAILLSQLPEILLPRSIRLKLAKEYKLTAEEQEVLSLAPQRTRDLVASVPNLIPVAKSIYYKDKGFDGSGLPSDTVKGEEIPMNARYVYFLQQLIKQSQGKPPTKLHFMELTRTPELFDPKLLEAARMVFTNA
ncbi:MAG: HD domain-containing phosphohydrolase [Methyloligellaceae bacterium]